MAAVEYNSKRAGCYLGESASLNIINEEITIASGAGKLEAGTVLGKITASSKYVLHDAGLSNGAQVGDAILFDTIDATSADVKAVATVNGPATISGPYLTFKAGISDANKLAAIKALRAKGMKVLPQHAS